MKKLLIILALLPTLAFAQMTVPQGGTGTTTFPTGAVVVGSSTLRLSAPLRLFWDWVNNRLGVGTTTPTNTLTVDGTTLLHGNVKLPLLSDGCLQTSSTIITSTGSVCASGGNSAWTIGNGFIYNATTTDRVGVGTSTPLSTAKLDVWGNLNVGTSSIPLLLANTATGKVGIGTSTPSTLLDIDGVTTYRGNILAGTDNAYDIGASGVSRPRNLYLGNSLNVTTALNGSAIAVVSSPIATSGAADLMNLTVNTAGLTSAAGFNGLVITKSGTDAPGTSYYLRVRDNSTDVFQLRQAGGEIFYKPTGLTGFGSFQYDGANTSNLYGFFRGTNAQAGIVLRNVLTTDNGTGVGFRFAVTTNSAYTPVSNGDAKVLVVGNGMAANGLSSDNMWVTASGTQYLAGSLGIGTTSPSAKLDVWGNLNVGTSSTPTLFVNTATGNVGIGTSTSASGLEIAKNFGSQLMLGMKNQAGVINFRRGTDGASAAQVGYTSAGDGSSFQISSGGGAGTLTLSAAGGSVLVNAANTFHSVFHSNGNFGIGTTTPSAKLAVTGTAGGGDIFAVASSTNARLFTITSGGNVGIGTTSPISAFSVNGTSTANCFALNSSPNTCIAGGGSGTVTSVDMTTPTGLSVSGNPITTSGTLALALTAGYNIPLSASTTNWNNFYDTPSTRITAGTGLSWSANTLNCATASGSTQGCLTSADWTTFNNKQNTITFVDSETPSGTVNGSNVTFTLANTPTAGSVHLYINGQRMAPTTDYSISGVTITMVTAPPTSSILLADYRR